MASTPCKGLKKDGTPCRGNGLEQLDGYCIAHAPADEAWQWRSPGGKASPASRLPSCAQNFFARSLVNARATLVHLSHERSYVRHPFNRRQKASSAACARPAAPTPAAFACHPSAVMRRKLFGPISRKLSCNARPSLERALLPVPPLQPPPKGFQRGPCSPDATTPAPFASHPSAVMHLKFICPISRPSLVNARPSLVRALLPVPPLQPPPKGFQRGLCPARRDHAGGLRQPPVCRHAPKTFCPVSRKLSCNARPSLERALLPVPPLQPPPKGFQRGPCPPRPTTPAAFACHPSAVMHPKLFCPISRPYLVNARQSLVRARVRLQRLQPPPKGLQRGLCPAPAATPAAFACRPLHLAPAAPILDRHRKVAGNRAV